VVGLGVRVEKRLNVAANAQSGYADLTWPSAAGEFFFVEYSANPAAGFKEVLTNSLLATPPVNRVMIATTNSQGYYRLRF
jgi:hypothetical protein